MIQDAEATHDTWREYQVLHAINEDENISQRSIADRVGIALGLANQIVKRLVRKGLVKTSRVNAKRIAYFLTPQGFSEKFRLVMEYTRCTISFFSAVRQIVCRELSRLKAENGIRTIAITGTGEIAEAVYLSAQELGLKLTTVYENNGPDIWLGAPVRPLYAGTECTADVVVVTALDEPGDSRSVVGRIAPLVVEMRELLSDGLATFAKRFVQEAMVSEK